MSLQQDLILSLPHFALKQFLPEFVATVLKVFSASKSVYVFMYVYISSLQKFKYLFLANGNFPDTIQAGTSSWFDYKFSPTWSASRQAKDVWKVSTIGIILHFISLSCPLSSLCLLYPWGKTWGSGKALNLCRDTSDNICQYTSDTQHILNNVFSADQIWQEPLNIVGLAHLKPCHMFISSDHKNTFYLVQGSGWGKS